MQESKIVLLTDKQCRFCEEYLVDLNATQAAIRAGYSRKTANQQGPRLLVNVGIQTEIAKAKARREEKSVRSAMEVIRELEKIGFADICDRLPAASKVRTLELLGKHHGVIGDKLDVRGNHGFQLILGKKE